MSVRSLRLPALVLASSLSLSACAYGYGDHGYASVGYGHGGYCDPYYDNCYGGYGGYGGYGYYGRHSGVPRYQGHPIASW